MPSKVHQLLIASLFAVSSPLAWGQAEQVEIFIQPARDEMVTPRYPSGPLSRGEEGTVHVNYMVDTDGIPFEAMVIQHTGNEAFQEAALEALSQSRFKPAMQNGEPIVGSSIFTYTFTLEDDGRPKAATESFGSRYNRYTRALERGEQERIETALVSLDNHGSRNHYENAYLNLAHFNYAVRYGDQRQQMEYLHGALSWSSQIGDPVYFDTDFVRELRLQLFVLQILNSHMAEALDTFALLYPSNYEERSAEVQGMYDQVLALRDDDRAYGVPLTLDGEGVASIGLFKRTLFITDVNGEVAELKLFCQKEFATLVVETDFSYDIPEEWGGCTLYIQGRAGTEFTLVQH